jgi:hypothetical protein
MSDDDDDDSSSMPSGNLSQSFSSTTEKSDGYSQTSGTDSSWNLARTETKRVNRSKVLLMGVMVIAAGVLALFTFLIVDQEEDDDFQTAVSSK